MIVAVVVLVGLITFCIGAAVAFAVIRDGEDHLE